MKLFRTGSIGSSRSRGISRRFLEPLEPKNRNQEPVGTGSEPAARPPDQQEPLEPVPTTFSPETKGTTA